MPVGMVVETGAVAGDLALRPAITRHDHIAGPSLPARPDALALLALGSVGRETGRADRWSDLDFFVIVCIGAKPRHLADLGWLQAAHPLAWTSANTRDGFKALMTDGAFCDFAVFEPAEVAGLRRRAAGIERTPAAALALRQAYVRPQGLIDVRLPHPPP